ncbi:MAG TPA: putative toxin-antitoxin system toxin component, PIN family [Acidobacteriota bacterium]
MTSGPLVVDTNVLVAGLIGSDSRSPPARILDALLEGRVPFLLSVALLAEYRTVLLRPKIARYHRLNATEIDIVLEQLALNAIVIEEPEPAPAAPDARDQHLWNLIHARRDTALVTGDRRLLDAKVAGTTIVSPTELLRIRPM